MTIAKWMIDDFRPKFPSIHHKTPTFLTLELSVHMESDITQSSGSWTSCLYQNGMLGRTACTPGDTCPAWRHCNQRWLNGGQRCRHWPIMQPALISIPIAKANSSNCLLEKWAVTAVCLCTADSTLHVWGWRATLGVSGYVFFLDGGGGGGRLMKLWMTTSIYPHIHLYYCGCLCEVRTQNL